MSRIVERSRQLTPHILAWELYTHGAYGFQPRPIIEEHIPKYAHTLEFAERLRGLINWVRKDRMEEWYTEQGIRVTSAYRHLEYNRKVGSGDGSMHTDPRSDKDPYNRAPCALDLAPYPIKGEGEWQWFNYNEFYKMAEHVDDSFPDRPYRLGYYGESGFVHVDSGYGYQALRWTGK